MKQKPIKLTNFLKKNDAFKKEATIMLNSTSKAEYSNCKLPFSKVKSALENCNAYSTLREILDEVAPEELVNVAAYASLTKEPVEVDTQWGPKLKRSIELHDDDDIIMNLTLWSNQINLINTNGNYKFKDLRVKSYNGKYLTSTAMTVIQPASDLSFEARDLQPEESKSVNFPPICIDHFEESYCCAKCKRKSDRCGDFIVCESCGAKSLFLPTSKHLFIKASFEIDSVIVSIKLPHKIVWPFLFSIGMTVENSRDDLEMALLTTTKDYVLKYKNNTGIDITKGI